MTEESSARGVLLAGVGGQGTVLASTVLAEALLSAGFEVKQSEVHGMAQRGGSVVSHVRFGATVSSPLISLGSAEVLVAFEWAEALRWLPYVAPVGAVVIDSTRIVPPTACLDRREWSSSYPTMASELVRERVAEARLIDASGIAAQLGNVKAANSVLLGALASLLGLPNEVWMAAIRARVPPGTVELNLAAFRRGSEAPSVFEDRISPHSVPGVGRHSSEIQVIRDWCKGCDICVRVCPEYCLALDEEEIVIATAPERCTGCRLCELLCPDFAITIRPQSRVPASLGGGR
ncbi:MAG TPA: 2-oxoacid:acceptor oxidoreductase family protein [Acidimicrobiia bacterium]|nr:2-oxoacid:acceptor oxidoreductase family protein [Acidimicrobiia bacterium]